MTVIFYFRVIQPLKPLAWLVQDLQDAAVFPHIWATLYMRPRMQQVPCVPLLCCLSFALYVSDVEFGLMQGPVPTRHQQNSAAA